MVTSRFLHKIPPSKCLFSYLRVRSFWFTLPAQKFSNFSFTNSSLQCILFHDIPNSRKAASSKHSKHRLDTYNHQIRLSKVAFRLQYCTPDIYGETPRSIHNSFHNTLSSYISPFTGIHHNNNLHINLFIQRSKIASKIFEFRKMFITRLVFIAFSQ